MKNLFLSLIIFLAIITNAYGQKYNEESGFISRDSMMVLVTAGYGITSVGGLNDYYKSLINELQGSNV